MTEPNTPAEPKTSNMIAEQTSSAAGMLATQALAVSNNSPEQALVALLIAACWVGKGCALPGITDPKILEMMKQALDQLAPGAFIDLDAWRQRQAAAAAAAKSPTDV